MCKIVDNFLLLDNFNSPDKFVLNLLNHFHPLAKYFSTTTYQLGCVCVWVQYICMHVYMKVYMYVGVYVACNIYVGFLLLLNLLRQDLSPNLNLTDLTTLALYLVPRYTFLCFLSTRQVNMMFSRHFSVMGIQTLGHMLGTKIGTLSNCLPATLPQFLRIN